MPPREQAIVRPVKGGQWKFKQSRFEQMPRIPFRIICTGRSGSGKGCCVHSAILDQYRGCWHKIMVISRTAHLDTTWKDVVDYAAGTLHQDQEKEPFVFTSSAGDGIAKRIQEHTDLVKKLKAQKAK